MGVIVISVKNALADSVTLIFDLSTPKSHHFYMIFQSNSLYQVKTHCDHSFLRYAADKHRDKQTDGAEHPTHADQVCRLVMTVKGQVLSVFTQCVIIYTLSLQQGRTKYKITYINRLSIQVGN